MAIGPMFLLCCLLFSSLTNGQNVVEKLEDLGLTTLVQYIEIAGLTEGLSLVGPWTVMAPSNEAFASLPSVLRLYLEQNPEAMTQMLAGHVVFDSIRSADLQNDQVALTIAEVLIRFNLYQNNVTVNGVLVTDADQEATNGIIHVVDEVLYPFASDSIFGTVAQDPNYAIFPSLLRLSGLEVLLSDFGPYTVFAPDDVAFLSLPEVIIDELLSNPFFLFDTLSYHIVSGTYYSRGLQSGDQLTTLQGSTITVSERQGRIYVEDAEVLFPDYPCTNGVVHAVETVLLPLLNNGKRN